MLIHVIGARNNTLRKKGAIKCSPLVPYMEPFMVLKGTTKGS